MILSIDNSNYEILHSNEISTQIHLSPHTIITYRRNLLKKLDAKNGADMVRIAFSYGVLHIHKMSQVS
ncbi:MAG: hypothetical protein HKO66_08760 [Saprospiraceae bacterium]|nr:hypothetical protein [Saprospiraceae bacterium]NNL92308.1 hypothetical protein [Saprospiraceae bacterium]